MADPYCLANGVLKNRYGLKTQAELDGVERDTAAVIEAEIYEDGYDGW